MSDTGAPESHGVHGAAREDGGMQEEPTGADGTGEETPDGPTDTAAEAT